MVIAHTWLERSYVALSAANKAIILQPYSYLRHIFMMCTWRWCPGTRPSSQQPRCQDHIHLPICGSRILSELPSGVQLISVTWEADNVTMATAWQLIEIDRHDTVLWWRLLTGYIYWYPQGQPVSMVNSVWPLSWNGRRNLSSNS